MIQVSASLFLLLTLFTTLVSTESIQPKPYTLFHRIIDPTSSSFSASHPKTSSWSPRAILEFDPSSANPIPSYQSLSQDALVSLLEDSKGFKDESSFYQLMLVQGSKQLAGSFDQDVRNENGLLTSLKKCHLTSSHTISELITLHISSSKSPRPYALDYSIRGLTLSPDGCPKASVSAQQSPPIIKTEIKVRTPSAAPSPPLRTPVPVKEDGTAKEPVPEKSFIQKYWYYAIPILLLLAMPAEEPESAEADKTSSQAPSAENRARRLK